MNQTKGFTLIELMIVVAVVGILSSIAMAFYGDNVIAANRTEGRAALAETAGSLEKCRSLYGAYNSASCNVVVTPVATKSNYYSVSATAIAVSSFTLTAAPVVGEVQASDSDCGSLSLTNTGIKTSTGGNPPACW